MKLFPLRDLDITESPSSPFSCLTKSASIFEIQAWTWPHIACAAAAQKMFPMQFSDKGGVVCFSKFTT
jgi:hypothetical protein